MKVDHPFSIAFDDRDRDALHKAWDSILTSGRWTEGPFTAQFESLWSRWNGLPAVSFSSWSGCTLAALRFMEVQGHKVLCPTNTFMATVNATLIAGGDPVFVDCNREDLCISFEDFVKKATEHNPKAAWVVHIGGHIAFEIQRIADYCRAEGIYLLEDCAHAHGADWAGKKPGTWGDAGVFSFYATKTVTTGEGGMLVSKMDDLISFAHTFRNYGKPSHEVEGLGLRMSEFTAALGVLQTKRLPEIIDEKNRYVREVLNPIFSDRVILPEDMTSGYYKYIVFSEIPNSTGRVYEVPCHRILGYDTHLPNSDWAAENHWCVPIYYHGGEI